MKAIYKQRYYIILITIIITIINSFSYALSERELIPYPINNIPIATLEASPVIQIDIPIKLPSEYEKFISGECSDIKKIIWDNAVKQNIDPKYLLGVCLIETGGTLNPNTIGPRTYCGRAKGIMQLMPELIKDYKIEDPFDPKENIKAGTKHLKYLIDLYKDLKIYDENENLLKAEYIAVISYNWGQGNVDRMIEKYNCIIIERLPYESKRYLKLITLYCNGDMELFKKLME